MGGGTLQEIIADRLSLSPDRHLPLHNAVERHACAHSLETNHAEEEKSLQYPENQVSPPSL